MSTEDRGSRFTITGISVNQPARGWTEKSSLAGTGGQAEGPGLGVSRQRARERRGRGSTSKGMGLPGAWASRCQRQRVPRSGEGGGQMVQGLCAGKGVGPSSFEPW